MATFGATTQTSTIGSIGANAVTVSSYVLTEDGYLTSISNWASTAVNFVACVYADSAGSTGALLGTTNSGTYTAGGSFVAASFATPLHLAAGTYWLGTNNNGTHVQGLTGVVATAQFVSSTYPTFPNPYGTPGGGVGTHRMSTFATYDATPVNSAAPTVTGLTTVGSLLTTTNGTWTNSPTFTYQWTRDGSNIAAATSSTYTTVSADIGHAIGATVTATNGAAHASQVSSNTITAAAATTTLFDDTATLLAAHISQV